MRSISQVLALFDIFIDEFDTDNIVMDSRAANDKSIFIAQKGGSDDGRKYINSAIENGAKLILVSTSKSELHGEVDVVSDALIIQFFELSKHLGFICSAFYQHASKRLQTIAVTGTNGKTSVTHICAQLSALCEEPAGTIGTMGVAFYQSNRDISKISDTINTTPDLASIHRLSSLVKQHGGQRLCIEASSHGLHQKRLSGFNTQTAIFTNLTQDHLDYHHSFEEYARAKRLLLQQEGLRSVVLNADDNESVNWVAALPSHMSVCLCSIKAKDKSELFESYSNNNQHFKYCIAKSPRFTPSGSGFELESSWGIASISLPMIGMFNISNLLSALSALLMQGMDFDSLIAAIPLLQGVPGRMEVFESRKHGNIIVDYAHTPDALEQALLASRPHVLGKLTVVFGCGGDRDATKRSIMGRIAEKWADNIVLTQDNSRSESPENIIADITQGMQGKSNLSIELERKDAIKKAYLNTQNDDLILVAGKGHEEYLELNNVREYYNEREYVKQLTLELLG
ncbi:UDP-N-acetylmuramoyl-L-alanyl-D-glutamate--2,6-diaminopimelate ligase [Glaciecola sp. MH2013]|nr:UDP-N-acetylmuramoyl-L-alanyl-D-glutamate--2,6-diaminopimelate ligase [Glaciecola sp. MH2013]